MATKEYMDKVATIIAATKKAQLDKLNDQGIFTVEDFIEQQKIVGRSKGSVQAELDLCVKVGTLKSVKKAKLNRNGAVCYVDAYRVPEKAPAKK